MDLAFALGCFGAFMNVVWPLFKGRTGMLLAQMGVSVPFGLHYLLNGAMTGAWMNAIAVAQAALAIPLGERPGFRVAYVATLPVIAATLASSWDGAASVCAAVGMALVSLGRYQLDPIRFRLLLVVAVGPWVAHNALVGSIPGLIADACAFTSGLVMLVRTIRSERQLPT